MRTFTAVIERDPDTGLFVGYVPGWPGAHSQGASVDELRQNLEEVVAMLLEDGEPKLQGEFIGTQTVKARGLEDRVHVVDEVCLGHCLRGPNILVQEEGATDEPFGGVLYNRMTVEDLDRVIEKHLVGGMAVRILMNRPPVKDR